VNLPGVIEAGDRVPSNLSINGHSFHRVEVLTPRRRRWSGAEKVLIVAESQAPDAQASAIALRYGLRRNQLYDWRRKFGSGAVANAMAEADLQGPDFVPVVVGAGCGAAAIEIGSASVRVRAWGSIWPYSAGAAVLKAMK
jgi:Transposase